MFANPVPYVPNGCRRPVWRRFLATVLFVVFGYTHATSAQAQASALALVLPQYALVMLGEVHDNAQGHELRRQAVADALDARWRPIIAMEQFDREHQSSLNDAMQTCADAQCVINAASPGNASWNWDYYRPVIELALRYRLPLLAVNLSRADAGRVMKAGLAAVFSPDELHELGLERGPDPGLLRDQINEVIDGHCGMLPPEVHTGMATAQIARDAMMALLIGRAAHDGLAQPVVLLAGNGHVRRDKGVPRWLNDTALLSVGFTEGAAPVGMFDRNVVLALSPREDPCVSLQETFKK